MSIYSEFYLNSPASIPQLDCFEISHSAFSKIYYIVRNATLGVTVTHEDTSTHFYEYYPLRIKPSSVKTNLDQFFLLELGDLGEVLPLELDRVKQQGKFKEFPLFKYRTFRGDDLSAPIYGPATVEISKIGFNKDGAVIRAGAKNLNTSLTGESYTLNRFPMLKGCL